MNFFSEITPNTTVLTPNRRLSAFISEQYSNWQMQQEKACWKTLDVLPLYPSWLERTWINYTAQSFKPQPRVLSSREELIIWEKILRENQNTSHLLQISAAAKLAKSAWEILKKWQISTRCQLKTEMNNDGREDSKAFLTWAEQFVYLSQHDLADLLKNCIQQGFVIPPEKIILVGFIEIAPQYLSLLEACKAAGTQIIFAEKQARNLTAHRIALTDTETELRTMARWAKSLLEKNEKSICCIIPQLESLRDQAARIFSETMREEEFNISAGKSLISYPVIQDAFYIFQLFSKSFSSDLFRTLLLSPFIGEAESERIKRALLENELRLKPLTSLYNKKIAQFCPALAARIKQTSELTDNLPKRILCRDWPDIFNKLLSIMGWPGERSVNSVEYQVIKNAWLPLLHEFSSCALEELRYEEALHYLHVLAAQTVFQAESPKAPVQILGILEAAEIAFDHSWVMGLDDMTWPPRPRPNPFIPLRLQKKLNMPNASSEREFTYCQDITQQLQRSAKHIIFSHALQKEDSELRPSPLIENYQIIPLHELSLIDFISQQEKINRSQQLDYFEDNQAPAFNSDQPIAGGTTIFKTQAQCGFKAFVEMRLNTKFEPEAQSGLNNLEKGTILHKALELIWKELKTSAVLAAKSEKELELIVQGAVTEVLSKIDKNFENKRYFRIELNRLKKILHQWLEIERKRPAFQVTAMEKPVTATIGKVTTQFRIDRIDQILSDPEAYLIIDYKSGKDYSTQQWFGEKLEEPQLPIYSIVNANLTLGIAFAKIHPEEMALVGTGSVEMGGEITTLDKIKSADSASWVEQIHIWQKNLIQLSEDFYAGKAAVSPKDPQKTCRYCGLQPLCRIHEIHENET